MPCQTPIIIRSKKGNMRRGAPKLYNVVPCGKCEYCLKHYVSAWSSRLSLVSRHSNFSFFVTLTYADDALPKNGEVCKSDVQKFFKRIRKHFEVYDDFDLKYVLISEYGPSQDGTHRPHYHGLFFSNYVVDYPRFWPFGLVTCDLVISERIHYVAMWHINKGFFVPPGKCENFRLSSKGLGYDAFVALELENARNNDWKFVIDNEHVAPIHRYFKDKFRDEVPPYELPEILSDKPPLTRQQVLDFNSSISIRASNFINKMKKKKSKFN